MRRSKFMWCLGVTLATFFTALFAQSSVNLDLNLSIGDFDEVISEALVSQDSFITVISEVDLSGQVASELERKVDEALMDPSILDESGRVSFSVTTPILFAVSARENQYMIMNSRIIDPYNVVRGYSVANTRGSLPEKGLQKYRVNAQSTGQEHQPLLSDLSDCSFAADMEIQMQMSITDTQESYLLVVEYVLSAQ